MDENIQTKDEYDTTRPEPITQAFAPAMQKMQNIRRMDTRDEHIEQLINEEEEALRVGHDLSQEAQGIRSAI